MGIDKMLATRLPMTIQMIKLTENILQTNWLKDVANWEIAVTTNVNDIENTQRQRRPKTGSP